MTFDVLDETTLARLGNIDVWVSVYWDEPYNSEGSFTLEVRPTVPIEAAFGTCHAYSA